MVRIDNIFEASLSQTQALAADIRIDISSFSDGELTVRPLRMVRIDNIFEALLSQTQVLAADLRIDIFFDGKLACSPSVTNGTDRCSVLT